MAVKYSDLPTSAITSVGLLCISDNGTLSYKATIDSLQTYLETNMYTVSLLHIPDGTVAAPSLYFGSDTNTGIYRIGADTLGIAAGGSGIVSITTTGAAITGTLSATGVITAPAGAVGAVGLKVGTNAGTGIYAPSATQLGLAANGTLCLRAESTGKVNLGIDGTQTAPAISFLNSINTGMYYVGADTLGFSANGSNVISANTTSISVGSPINASAGSVGAPGLYFAGSSTTGLYESGLNEIGISTSGVNRLAISSTALTATVAILSSSGTAAAPGVSFSADTNTGIYRIGADSLGLSAGGTLRATIDTTGLTVANTTFVADGSIGSPGLTFTSDTNTGFYRLGADSFSATCGGVQRLNIAAAGVTSIGDLYSNTAVYSAAGTNTVPSYSFTGDPNTGFYNIGADNLGLTLGGTLRVNYSATSASHTCDILPSATATYDLGSAGAVWANLFTSNITDNGTNIITTGQLQSAVGSAASPTYSFGGDPDTGMFNAAANTLTFSTGGTTRATITSSDFTVASTQLIVPLGSAGSPSVSFSGDVDTGIYRTPSTANSMNIACGGVASYVITDASLRPNSSSQASCGTSGALWTEVWATDGSINTSDEKKKELIYDSKLGYDFVMGLRPVEYRWKAHLDARGNLRSYKRKHQGFIAQEVEKLLNNLQVDTNDFAGFIKDGDDYFLRYQEFFPPMIKAFQEYVAMADERMKALEQRIQQLESASILSALDKL